VNLAGKPPQEYEHDPAAMTRLFLDSSASLRDRCRLACLTLSGPNEWSSLRGYGDGYGRARMWAQYADHHSGVCLAFDQKRLREAARRVGAEKGLRLYEARVRYLGPNEPRYPIQLSLARVLVDLPGLINEIFPTVVGGLYFEKAWDWSTESEYRLLLDGDVAEYEFADISRALTGVFCGSRFPEARLDDLRARCPGLLANGRIFRMMWRNGFPIAMPVESADPSQTVTWDAPPLPLDLDPLPTPAQGA
jgi:hypothetical protein